MLAGERGKNHNQESFMSTVIAGKGSKQETKLGVLISEYKEHKKSYHHHHHYSVLTNAKMG